MLTTRSMSWRTEVSRSGVPRWPRKYLLTDDVGRELAPEVGDLDVLLLEDALARFVGDAGGPVLPGDLVVGMDVRAGPAALEGQAAGCLSPVKLAPYGPARPGVGAAVWSAVVGRLLGLRAAVMGCDRCPVPSSHLLSLLVVSDARSRGSCRIALASLLPNGPGGRSGPADGAGGERVGRLGSISRPLERYAESWSTSTPKPQDVVVVLRCRALHVVVWAIHARVGVRPRSGGVRPHARRCCPPVRAPVDIGLSTGRPPERSMVHPF